MNNMRKTNGRNGRGLRRALLAAALLLAGTLPAQAQDFYVITAGSTNYLAHNAALTGGLTNATSFNATTCLWTISGSNIIAIAPDGTTGYQLSHSGNYNSGYTLTLAASGQAWSGAEDGSIPYRYLQYSRWNSANHYLYYNSGWNLDRSNSNGTLTKVTVTDAPYTAGSSTTSYSASLGGDGVIYSTSGTHTYTVDITQVITYAQTRRTFGTYGTVTVNVPSTVSNAYTGALTDVAWSVSDNAYGATITSGGVLTVTSLPASVDNLTVTYTAQAGGQPVSGTMTVMLAKDEATAEGVAGQATGVSGTTVTLNDYEDHSWSYYNKEDNSPIRSWNPANVKITYNGNGNGNVQTNNNDTPSTWGANATTVKVGIDADANKFVYYKTLERTDGRTAANPTGRCAYTTIANPFAVRPTYDSDGTSKYRGFYAWRVKTLSGGTIHSAATGGTSYGVGSTINAETEIYFAPSSEYGMTVEFEALWARAYVSTSGVPSNNLGVERNFYVINASATSDITAGNRPCTYTSIYPNGTTDGTTAATSVTVYKYGGFTAAADSKIEYIILRNNNSTINAAGHNFTIGRGVSGYNGGLCATNLYGLNANATTDFRFNFASGRFTNLYFCGSGRNMTGKLTSVIGCDYDRAMGDNSKLKVTDDIIAGYNGSGGSNGNEGEDFLVCTVRSGDFDLGNYGGGAQFYLSLWGNTGSGTYGKKTMIVEGGVFSDISGGIDVNDNQVAAADMVEIRVKGGTINGALYGAAQYAAGYGNRRIVITGGDLKGWVAGGANGTRNDGGQLSGASSIYVGGNARIDSKGSTEMINSASGGNVFGAGCGFANGAAAGEVTVSTTVVVADNAYIERGVYGGGGFGYCNSTSSIYIMGGIVAGMPGGVTNDGYTGTGQNSVQTNKRYVATMAGGVFGGACQNRGGIVNILMSGGEVYSGVYGGSNSSGTVAGPVNVTVSGGTVGTAGINPATSETGHVFGSGYGAGTSVTGNVTVTIGDATGSHKDSPLIYGNVYGGGFAAPYTSNGKTFQVTGQNGLVKGSIFGGGKGNTAVVTGPTDVLIKGNIEVEGNVFGGGDAAAVTGNTSVKLQD